MASSGLWSVHTPSSASAKKRSSTAIEVSSSRAPVLIEASKFWLGCSFNNSFLKSCLLNFFNNVW
ncbi:hypothetical protein RO3G_15688 [Rhizopus delemar RA 99-880]|uniref:Uncharacterized protein n=1 Tax=Rhizopus delemar (strain RA 99-880 / ATCC MYA-4621 / FGSC 9543 / NRRL 43880) TaxID=246409 RepID=I1CR97_RHIO9|nr:hypothetical protein RO3G_15688 [Rhizopus delemar RA 99-880]|eukprot:EIE90977.1 hypothetical protein RO3G_15688 [Rhizopus delemar RA 99-880]